MKKEKVYEYLSHAETGSEKNPYIRTRVKPKGGSTAFGPVQITKTLADDYVKRGKVSKESAEYYKKRLEPMFNNFNKHGGNKGKIKDYDPDYDYGGSGKFDGKKEGENYKKFAHELIEAKIQESKGDENKFIQSWRGKGEKDDPEYYKRYRSKKQEKEIGDEFNRQMARHFQDDKSNVKKTR